MSEDKYVGYCVDCGKHIKEYCHNYRCLDCCRKYNELFDYIPEEDKR